MPANANELSGEDALIVQLAGCLPTPQHTRLAIGDDAAVIAQPDGSCLLVTTDLLMEDVHFRLSWGDLPALGWKSLAQNLSDIAAMGGTPTHAVIAIGIPPQWQPAQAIDLYRGLAELAKQSQTDIVGGDTIRSIGPLTIDITVLGTVAPNELLTRSGARPGDALFVTGSLGRAAAGLRVLESGHAYPAQLCEAVQAQLRPEPRLAAARALATSGLVTGMMDLSDGIATDIHRLCRQSHVGAIIAQDRVPVASVTREACQWLATFGDAPDPITLALRGGEDFELLFTAPPGSEAILAASVSPLPITRVGTMTESADILLQIGHITTPLTWGFTHF